ncbi:MAG: cytochrome c3 family protein, partial [Candidatus Obscuribacterales bacterium]|nr:cytochrome c3 family protein [Candidatus Obscuribacterales bacterium]
VCSSDLTAKEMTLNCAVCHASQDVHRKLFGADCASCHTTDNWQVAEFVHPSMKSENCASCHQAPPSHSMMHFQMVSMPVAKQHHTKVEQCYVCHQTNDWNDIKGIGWYKHH